MFNMRVLTLFFFVIFTAYSGCAGLGELKSDLNSLADKKFTMTEFQYIHTSKDGKYAYNVMQNFPVKKILYILSKEYGLEIDMSEYYRFIKNGSPKQIKTEGFVRNEKFIWKSADSASANRVIIHFEKDYFDETKMKFSLVLYNGNKKLNSIIIDFSKEEYLFRQLDFYISKTDEYAADFDRNDYNSKDNVPGLILGDPGSWKTAETDKKDEIKAILEQYVNTLNPEQKKAFKHEIIDHIYKISE